VIVLGEWASYVVVDEVDAIEGMARDSWHSYILINGSSFIFVNEMNHFRYYLMSSAPYLKGFANTKL
jgi:hypothetical protein